MKYLHIQDGSDFSSTELEPTSEYYQDVEDSDLAIIRWNEQLKCFEGLSCESQGDVDTDDKVIWSITWEKI